MTFRLIGIISFKFSQRNLHHKHDISTAQLQFSNSLNADTVTAVMQKDSGFFISAYGFKIVN